jgi:outer membrane protein assembly factor BamB
MKTLSALAVGLLLCPAVYADDWPQWRGPNRDGVSKETGLLKTWPKEGPKLLWTYKDAGVGYSCPAVVGDRLYTMGGRSDGDYLFALDVKEGKELWAFKIGPVFTFKGNAWGDGPRGAPSVDGQRVYALDGGGDLVCVDAAKGTQIWRKNMSKDLNGEVNPVQFGPGGWGWSWSPLVDGDQVICVPGGKDGALAALNKKTGEVVWRSKELTDLATYSSPIMADIGGIHQYIEVTNAGVAGVEAKGGKLLWNFKRPKEFNDVVIPTPVFHDNAVYMTVTSLGFRGGCDLVKLTPDAGGIKATKGWSNLDLPNTTAGVVLVGEHIYGYSESKRTGGWVCQEFKTGKIVWNEPDALDRGSLIAADGCLYCYGEESGILALVEANPAEKWKEKARFEIPEKSKHLAPNGKIWTPPVIANGKLYLRDQELLFCYAIK